MSNILINILCFNESKSLNKVINDLKSINHNLKIDLLIVNDASTDDSQIIIEQEKINYIKNSKNIGIAKSLKKGYEYFLNNNYDYFLQFDGDGQHRYEFISELINTIIKNNADLVIGSRYLNKKLKFNLKSFGSAIISLLIKFFFKMKIKDPTSGFRILKRDLIKEIIKENIKLAMEPLNICQSLKNNKKVIEIPVIMNERKYGKSTINNINGTIYMIYFILKLLWIFINDKKNI